MVKHFGMTLIENSEIYKLQQKYGNRLQYMEARSGLSGMDE